MIISSCLEKDETRISITPRTAKQYIQLGFQVSLQNKAGLAAGFSNADYVKAGASLVNSKTDLLKQSQILLCFNEPRPQELKGIREHALIITHADSDPDSELIRCCQKNNISLLSMNHIPRISRAQSMDSLSSQANLAGYKAVLEAVNRYHQVVPMMMTAAGMIKPAKVLILGAGVAGLQAIATAKRLGAVVYAFDVRSAAKEQVESLGAEFIEVPKTEDFEAKGGYAKETSEEYKALQAELIDKYAQCSDIVITTALIPNRSAPVLLYKKTIEAMKPGSVIVDLATSRGGNCELSLRDKTIEHNKITIIGTSNMAGLVPTTASELYANNLFHLIKSLATKSAQIQFNAHDEIIQQALLCHEKQYLPFREKSYA